MSRELKRVPLDFQWEQGIVWEGYQYPDSPDDYEGDYNDYLYEIGWEKTEPPTGEGWQLWETVSEGSPISPVFPTQDEFRAYLLSLGYSENGVDNFIKVGYAFSASIVNGVFRTNIDTMED